MAGENAHLDGWRARKRLHEGEPLEVALLREPGAPLLHLGLNQAPHRGCAEADAADLEKGAGHFQQPAALLVHRCLLYR
jgi:hypothetical protein